jgi:predicted phage tail protein
MTGLPSGTYTCSVRATNALGSSVYTSASAALVIPAGPGAPTGVAATFNAAASTVDMQWTVPATDGGSPINGYDIKCTNTANYADSVSLSVATTVCTGTACGAVTVTGLASLSTAIYTCGVRAVNAVGTSAYAYPPCTGGAAPATCSSVSVCTVDNFANCGSCGLACYRRNVRRFGSRKCWQPSSHFYSHNCTHSHNHI